ncbi:MAG: class I SAM-dependent methyltransferase [Acidimicrobiia bacterium]
MKSCGRSRDYAEVYRSRMWAYGDKPDPEFIKALVRTERGKALDLAGGQGRHALALSALGFDVTLVDSVAEGLHQAAEASEERDLPIHIVHADAAKFQPDPGLWVICASLFFHIPARRTALKIAERLGGALALGGLLYLSLPGFTKETETLARDVLSAAGTSEEWLVKHLVTRKERPMLPVSRRNETRVMGKAIESAK